jgi:hypothetical protein
MGSQPHSLNRLVVKADLEARLIVWESVDSEQVFKVNYLLRNDDPISRHEQLNAQAKGPEVKDQRGVVIGRTPFSRKEPRVIKEERREVNVQPPSTSTLARSQPMLEDPWHISPFGDMHQR